MVNNKIAAAILGCIPFLRGWEIEGFDPERFEKSLLVVAPHTSYCDAFVGKYVLAKLGLEHRFLSASFLFRFPFGPFMRLFGSLPVGGIKGHNSITDVANYFKERERIHIVICPEGQLEPTAKWSPGFVYMAQKAGVPIQIMAIDYKKRKIICRGVITDTSNAREVMRMLPDMYNDVTARHPENFLLPAC